MEKCYSSGSETDQVAHLTIEPFLMEFLNVLQIQWAVKWALVEGKRQTREAKHVMKKLIPAPPDHRGRDHQYNEEKPLRGVLDK